MKNYIYKLSLLLAISLFYSNLAHAQQKPLEVSKRYVVVLDDGTQLIGTVLELGTDTVIFNDDHIGKITIKRNAIKTYTNEFGDKEYIFTLKNKTVLTGSIVAEDDSSITIQTKNIGKVILPKNKIETKTLLKNSTITEYGQIQFKNPNTTRYLFAPSAYNLKKGEGYYQNFYGVGSAVNYGLTDHISIGGGAVGFYGIYLTPKIATEVAKNVNIGAGLLVGNSLIPIDDGTVGFGIGYGLVTLGNTDHNITVGAGYGFTNAKNTIERGKRPMFVVNGMTRLGKKYALVSENWIIPVKGDAFDRGINRDHYEVVFSYAFRFMKEHKTIDIGFFNTPAIMSSGWWIGIPYIDFIIRFGDFKD